ncbi:MAG: YhdH/YhfP family quinone oxidoreductase, partial [Pirellulaceae bacterium]
MSSTNLAAGAPGQAFVVERDDQGRIHSSVQSLGCEEPRPGHVLIRAHWSSLNFKDALAATGHPGVVRRFPHVPGIDVAGTVVQVPDGFTSLAVGQPVLVTGYDLGAGQWGGWSEQVSVPAEWVVPCPPSWSLRDAMVLGTAGLTAAMGVETLQRHGIVAGPDMRVLVTGGTGGVGCLAIHLLVKLGYHVTAVTGKSASHGLLRGWGVQEILDRGAVQDSSTKPLLPAQWAGAIDTVGGAILATIVRQTKPRGCVAACGLVAGTDLPLTVYPFLLRGVTLAGIVSAWYPRVERIELWRKL